MSETPVTVRLKDLVEGNVPFSSLEDAFGPSSLGIIIVKDLPQDFVTLRHRLLSYSSYLGNLPEDKLTSLESREAKYLTGWSLGKESLQSGRPDTLKGSYYINCAFYKDRTLQAAPLQSPVLRDGTQKTFQNFPEHTAPNVWPSEDTLPGFKETAESLCNMIIDIAALVARSCDRFAETHVDGYEKGYMERMVKSSMTTKARLLHYFPPSSQTNGTNKDGNDDQRKEEDEDDWCGTHIDHSCLTGLTSAMYVDESAHPPSDIPPMDGGEKSLPTLPELSSPPDPKTGLYIHSRTGAVTKVSIPRDCVAFQTGEALELITKGKFSAVPHFVRGASAKEGAARVARNTLAVFTQPNLWEVVDSERGLDFAAFSQEVAKRHY